MPNIKDWKGVGDARPGSSPEAEKGQGGGTTDNRGDWKGEYDNRPSSSPDDTQRVNIGAGGSAPK